jgi:hypothetical protein
MNRIEESISRIELLGWVPVVLESNHTSFSLSPTVQFWSTLELL